MCTMASVERSGRSGRALRTVGRLSLYASYLAVWALIWGPATAIAYGRNELLKAAVGALFLLLPVVVIGATLLFRRTASPSESPSTA